MTAAVVLKKLDEMNENGRLLAMTAMVLGIIPAALSIPRYHHGTLGYATVLAVFVIGTVAAGILLAIGSHLVESAMQRRKNNFLAHFGLENPKSRKEIRIMQCAVAEKLRMLACNFRETCAAEEVFLRDATPVEVDAVKAARIELERLQFDIRCAKETFWHARDIAQLFSFKVKAHARDYWNEPRGH